MFFFFLQRSVILGSIYMVKIRVWDLPTRLFHWALVLCVLALVITGNVGGDAMVWHFRFGYTVLSLLIFRAIWGFVGGLWSRWSALRGSPAAVWSSVRHPSGMPQPGHSALGSLSVAALLMFLLMQVGTGLISDDEIATAGPFVPWVSSSLSAMATHWHTQTGKFVLLSLIALHIAAIWFYRRFKQLHLTSTMVTGDQLFPQDWPASRDEASTRLWAWLIWCLSAGLVFGLIQYAP
jgi:cytochrome b